jgi:hypothetical protein
MPRRDQIAHGHPGHAQRNRQCHRQLGDGARLPAQPHRRTLLVAQRRGLPGDGTPEISWAASARASSDSPRRDPAVRDWARASWISSGGSNSRADTPLIGDTVSSTSMRNRRAGSPTT